MVQHPRAAVTVAATTTNQVINSIINLLQLGRIQKAASILFAFPLPFPHSLYAHFFRHCTSPKAIVAAHKVEFHLVATTPNPPTFLRNRALEAYAKCSSLHDARELFDQMPHRDGGSWNALITAYSRLRYPDEALSLFLSMNRSGVRANKITFAGVLSSCAAVSELPLSQQVHGLVVKFGFCGNVIIGSALVDVYAKCGVMVYARRMFYEMPLRNAVTWNVIVRRYLDVGDVKEAVLKTLHAHFLKLGLNTYTYLGNRCIDLYTEFGYINDALKVFEDISFKNSTSRNICLKGLFKSGQLDKALRVFDGMPVRDVVSWNTMISGSASCGFASHALELFIEMQEIGVRPSVFTFSILTSVVSSPCHAKEVHGRMVKSSMDLANVVIGNSLITMYGKFGLVDYSFGVVSTMKQLDVISWNSLIWTCHRAGRQELALEQFCCMRAAEMLPDKFTCSTLMSVCSSLRDLAKDWRTLCGALKNKNNGIRLYAIL